MLILTEYPETMKSRGARIFMLALLASALGTSARADGTSPKESRATIRGTGNDVTIVYRGAANAPRRLGEKASARGEDVLAEAARLEAGGADDESVIAYLRGHQADLPPIVDAEEVRRLRRAGAGAPVISYLSRLTALDIGETAEGGAPSPALAPGSSAYGMPGEYVGTGYPFYGGGFIPRRPGHVRHPFPHPPSMQGGHAGFPGRPPMSTRPMRFGTPQLPQP
jgi:hypothetical protein